ncbi:MAG: glycosyltransferase [Paludibacteraceae bacterium]|nr:glycosyltransferase [Paludibacteraceae bacterium]
MKNKTTLNPINDDVKHQKEIFVEYSGSIKHISTRNNINATRSRANQLPEILFVTSYPHRECGIATYSEDLIKALNNKFSNSLSIKVCALESGDASYNYPGEVTHILDTSDAEEYIKLTAEINRDDNVKIVLVQHEFGFFSKQESAFLGFLAKLKKPVVIVFHTVLPKPKAELKLKVQNIVAACKAVIVMTNNAEGILTTDYEIPASKISVIAHGTHLVPHLSESFLKKKYGLTNRKVLTTFGLLSSGKSIETTIEALPAIVKQCPEVIFLIIGKTHPEVKKTDGEKYRKYLEQMVEEHGLGKYVKFINNYLALPELLEYLQLTDIYIFTTNDPNQAVSGTFAYAMSCACPIISTPIPHAREVLSEDTGIIFDFRNSTQLAESVISLLNDDELRKNISSNTLQKIVSTAWENSAVAHAMLFDKIGGENITVTYNLPPINLNHLQQMTTDVGIIQFSKINQPDIETGYTLDDNARALIATCMNFQLTGNKTNIPEIKKYLNFIKFCLQPGGDFLNYVDKNLTFTVQNYSTNLDDSNGRAVWALGYVISLTGLLPNGISTEAQEILDKTLPRLSTVHSTRSMAFFIKGLYYAYTAKKSDQLLGLINTFANRLAGMYQHEAEQNWEWFESYLTYANSILPEAMLCAWQITGEPQYKEIARTSFDFLLSKIFNKNGIEVISNRAWLLKGEEAEKYGEQPIDVAYTILSLDKFYEVFKQEKYREKIAIAFNWFLGHNRLNQIIYNPCTGGCYDGLEEAHVNLNQGAESTVSYLMARLTMEKYKKPIHQPTLAKSVKMNVFTSLTK